MTTLKKIGYIFIGFGVGIFAATAAYQHELDKPIGDIEAYIPKDENENQDDISEQNGGSNETAFTEISSINMYTNSTKDDALELKAQQRRSKLASTRADMHSGKTNSVRYSQMYDDGKKAMNDILKNEKSRQQQLDAYYDDDIEDSPSDDEPAEFDTDYRTIYNDDIVTERVEDNFEIYLAGEPVDYATLIYYQGDNTLTDDRDGIIPGAEDVVGRVAIDRLLHDGPGGRRTYYICKES